MSRSSMRLQYRASRCDTNIRSIKGPVMQNKRHPSNRIWRQKCRCASSSPIEAATRPQKRKSAARTQIDPRIDDASAVGLRPYAKAEQAALQSTSPADRRIEKGRAAKSVRNDQMTGISFRTCGTLRLPKPQIVRMTPYRFSPPAATRSFLMVARESKPP